MTRFKKFVKLYVIPFYKKFPPIYILLLFYFRIMLFDFRRYRKLKYKFGADCKLIYNVPSVTGDCYLFCMWFKQWVLNNQYKDYILLLDGKSLPSVVRLFPWLNKHWHSIDFGFPHGFYKIEQFLGYTGLGMEVTNKQNYVGSIYLFQSLKGKMLKPSHLLGYKGFSLVDYYIRGVFDLPIDMPPQLPVFDCDEAVINEIFRKNNAIRGKTILLAPYSTGNSENEASIEFWEQVAQALVQKGYSVFTNCAGEQTPIRGTQALFVLYKHIVPFLEAAGGLIAFRSGFCDLISSAKCKKVIIHSDNAVFWPRGNSIAYTGLVHMGLCNDAVEIVYEDNFDEVLTAVIAEFPRQAK